MIVKDIPSRDVVVRVFNRIFPDVGCSGPNWREFYDGFMGIKRRRTIRGLDDVVCGVWYDIGKRKRREYDEGDN